MNSIRCVLFRKVTNPLPGVGALQNKMEKMIVFQMQQSPENYAAAPTNSAASQLVEL